jgi:hypothetical protein
MGERRLHFQLNRNNGRISQDSASSQILVEHRFGFYSLFSAGALYQLAGADLVGEMQRFVHDLAEAETCG